MVSDSDLETSTPDEADDEAKASSPQILRHELAEAREALERAYSRTVFSGLSAGLDIGFSLLLVAVMHTIADGVYSKPTVELLVANMYAFGFILVVIGRSELFTEQTSLAVLLLLDGQTSLKSVAGFWGIVYVTNFIGGACVAAFIVAIGPALGIIDSRVFGEIAHRVTDHPWWVILLSGVMAGWLMGLLSWLVAAGRDTISQLAIVWMITTGIGFMHLHHTVVGIVKVLAGIFSGSETTAGDFGHFLLWTTLGNAVGGPLFVALLKYGHVKADEHVNKP